MAKNLIPHENMKVLRIVLSLLLLWVPVSLDAEVMSGGGFSIDVDVVNASGSDSNQNGSYKDNRSIGEGGGIGSFSGSGYSNDSGFLACCCGDSYPPGPITNLSALTGPGAGEITLSWTAPGDDGYIGIISPCTYRIDFSTDPTHTFDVSDYEIEIDTTNQSPGMSVERVVTGLLSNGEYFFRIWTADETNSFSGLSNGATAWTFAEPPSVSCDKSTDVWVNVSTFPFTNTCGFGLDGVQYYRMAWDTHTAYTWNENEEKWESGVRKVTATVDGSWFLHLRSYNGMDIACSTATFGPYKYDGTLPSIPTLLSPDNDNYTSDNTVWFDWTDENDPVPGSGLAGYELEISSFVGFSPISYSSFTTISESTSTVLADAKYWWHVRTKDHVSNYSDWSATRTLVIDTIAPVISNNQEGEGLWRNSSGQYDVGFYDTSLATAEYRATTSLGGLGDVLIDWTPIDKELFSATSGWWTVEFDSLREGTSNYVSVRANDLAMHTSSWTDAFHIWKDTTPPYSQKITSLTEVTTDSIKITASALDDTAGLHNIPWWFEEITGNTGGGGISFSEWVSNNIMVDSELLPNTSYMYQVNARDKAGNESGFSSSTSCYTLAEIPGAPALVDASTGTITVIIDLKNNPSYTEFSVKCLSDGTTKYVQAASGLLGDTTDWQTYSGWGGASGVTVSGLTYNISYEYLCRARNSEGIITEWSLSSSTYTLAQVPGTPTLVSTSTGSIKVIITPKDNPSQTEFSIKCLTEGTTKYVQGSGLLDSGEIWQTYSQWGSGSGTVVSDLSPNIQYEFLCCAKDVYDNITEWSQSASTWTQCIQPSLSYVLTISTSEIKTNIQPYDNPDYSQYSIKVLSQGVTYYVGNDYKLTGSEIFQTTMTWGVNFDVLNLEANTDYRFSVAALNQGGGKTAYSSPLSTYTYARIPSTPTVIADWDPVNHFHCDIVVQANGNPEWTEYAVMWDTSPVYWLDVDGSTLTQEVWIATTSWIHSNLELFTTYYYKVKARNGMEFQTALSCAGSTQTTGVEPPSGFHHSTATLTSITWQFRDNCSSEDGFRIYSATGGLVTTLGELEGSGATTSWIEIELSTDTQYGRYAVAYEPGRESPPSEIEYVYTLAQLPAAPVLTAPTSSSIDLGIITLQNPAWTKYSVKCLTNQTTKYLQDNYTLASSPEVFNDVSTWSDIMVSELSPNVEYTFMTQARNGDDILTGYSNSVTTYTLCEIPGKPVLTGITTGSICLTIVPKANSSPTTYSIKVLSSNSTYYVNTNYELQVSPPVYQSSATWNTVLLDGLAPNTDYTFACDAKNTYGNVTSYSTYESTYTHARIPGTPVLTNPTTWTMEIAWDTNENPIYTKYCIRLQYGANTKFVQQDNSLGDSPVWQSTSTWGSPVTVKNLSENTQYSVGIQACNELNVETAYSGIAEKWTTLNPPQYDDFVVNPTSSTKIDMSVPEPPNYDIGLTGSEFTVITGSTTGGTSSGKLPWDYTFTAEGLSENTKYGYKARYYNGGSEPTSYTAEKIRYTLCNDPTNFVITASSSTSLYLEVDTFPNDKSDSSAYYFKFVSGGSGANDSGYIQISTWTDTDLQANTEYLYSVKYRNGTGVETSTITASAVTLANAPGIPSLSDTTTGSLVLTIDANGNSDETQYAIKCLSDNTTEYIQDSGLRGSTTFWQSYISWGSASGKVVSGLLSDTLYEFTVVARNNENILTSYSSESSICTLAQVPGTPDLVNISTGSITVVIDPRENPTVTKYAIKCLTGNTTKYVQMTSGLLGDTTDWQSYANWGGVSGILVGSLTSNTQYTFSCVAKNQNNVVSDFGMSASTYTMVRTPGIPSLVDTSTGSTTVIINLNGNNPETEFSIKCLHQGTTDFVQANGMLDISEVWQTYSSWGSESGVVVSTLAPGTGYEFSSRARNNAGSCTDFSPSISTCTLAQIPGLPSLVDTSAESITIILEPKENSAETEFSIKCLHSGTTEYVQANGLLNSGEAWQTYSLWGNSSGKEVTGLTPNTNYEFLSRARNEDGAITPYSLSSTTCTFAQVPGPVQLTDVTTGSIKVIFNPKNNPSQTIFSIKCLSDGTTKYVQQTGLLDNTEEWQTYSDWGGSSGIVVHDLSANTDYAFSVRARNDYGLATAFSSVVSSYTLTQKPGLILVSVVTNTIQVEIDPPENPEYTEYVLKVFSEDTTYYVQTDYSINTSPLISQTTTQWGDIIIQGLTSNLGYDISCAASNGDGKVSSYSNVISTWTPCVVSPAPTVLGKYTEADEYHTLIIINPGSNSDYTEYAIKNPATGNFLQGDGSLGGDIKWKTKIEWEQAKKNMHKYLGPNYVYTYQVKARSPNRNNEETGFSEIGSGTTPPGETTISSVSEENNDYLMVSWGPVSGAVKYWVYYATYGAAPSSQYVQIGTATGQAFYNDDINGQTPGQVTGANTVSTSTSSISIEWSPVFDPSASEPRWYRVAGVNSYNAEGKKSDPSSGPNQVTPVILYYQIYENGVYLDSTTAAVTNYMHASLAPNTSYLYEISALSSDNIEGTKSVGLSACTLAQVPSGIDISHSWNQTNELYITLNIQTNENPNYTEYAVYWKENEVYLDASGLTNATPIWVATSTWKHSHLLPNTTYTYVAYARNLYGTQTQPSPETAYYLEFNLPVITKISCQYSDTDSTVIDNGIPTNHQTAYFYWDIPTSSLPVTGYSVNYSTNINDVPDFTVDIDTNANNYNVTIKQSDGTYYFTVRPKNEIGIWGPVTTFVYTVDTEPCQIKEITISGEKIEEGVFIGTPVDKKLSIMFNKALRESTASSSENVSLVALRDNLGNKMEKVVSGTSVFYDSDAYRINISSEVLRMNWTYKIIITTMVFDLAGNNLAHAFTAKFTTIMDNKEENVVVSDWDENARISIPANSLPENAYIRMNSDPEKNPLEADSDKIVKATNKIVTPYRKIIDKIEINAYNKEGKGIDTGNLSNVTLSMPYSDENSDGFIDDTSPPLQEKTLRLFMLENNHNLWVRTPDYSIDADNNIFRAKIPHFSVFALAARASYSVDETFCYPVPWIPEDNKEETGTFDGGITFTNLAPPCEIRVYKISGELVKKITVEDDLYKSWLGDDKYGNFVPSGVYLWIVESHDDKKTGKLMIIR